MQLFVRFQERERTGTCQDKYCNKYPSSGGSFIIYSIWRKNIHFPQLLLWANHISLPEKLTNFPQSNLTKRGGEEQSTDMLKQTQTSENSLSQTQTLCSFCYWLQAGPAPVCKAVSKLREMTEHQIMEAIKLLHCPVNLRKNISLSRFRSSNL